MELGKLERKVDVLSLLLYDKSGEGACGEQMVMGRIKWGTHEMRATRALFFSQLV